MTQNEVTGIITLVGIGCCAIALIALHILPTGLSPLRDPVSQYGISTYRLGYRIQTIAMGVAAIAAALGIRNSDVPGCTLVEVLLIIFGTTRLVIGWFPMDDPAAPRTSTGQRHGVLAILAFGSATIAAIRLGDNFHQHGAWGGVPVAISALGFAMLASLLAMWSIRRHPTGRRYFGLVERGFYVSTIAFLVIVGYQLVR